MSDDFLQKLESVASENFNFVAERRDARNRALELVRLALKVVRDAGLSLGERGFSWETDRSQPPAVVLKTTVGVDITVQDGGKVEISYPATKSACSYTDRISEFGEQEALSLVAKLSVMAGERDQVVIPAPPKNNATFRLE